MKRSGILNRELSEAIAGIGHGQLLMIVDAGFPIPDKCPRRIDLAIAKDYPDVFTMLKLVVGDLIFEKCIVAEEQKQNNPLLFEKISSVIECKCAVETVPHAEILEVYSAKASVIVRTGSFEPWGNLILISGIDAHEWFKKDGVVTPDYYKSRAEYIEKY